MLLLFFGMLIAKLAPLGNCASLPWWAVTMPLWIGFAILGAILGIIIVLAVFFLLIAGIVALFHGR